MFTHDRISLRSFYLDTFRKAQENQILTPLETQVFELLKMHPEYISELENIKILEKDFSVELGEINPFLHLGLHLGLREQVLTNRPQGITEIYQKLLIQNQQDTHQTEHQMMDYLAEALWVSQKYQTAPNEQQYLESLKKIV